MEKLEEEGRVRENDERNAKYHPHFPWTLSTLGIEYNSA